MIKSTLIYIVNSPVLFFGTFFLARACVWGVAEYIWRSKHVDYRKVAPKDFAAEIFHVSLVIPVVIFLYDRIFTSYPTPQAVQDIPIFVRVLLYVVICDFGYYWMHRLMHTGILWRAHKWHHSPTYMYWLAGCRATITQQFLVGVPYVLAAPILFPSPWWVYTALVIFDYLIVDWMHLNVSWGTRWLEWFIVTPRYHRIHHSSNPQHYDRNLGDFFTIWDRLFGTYLDPDTLDDKALSFGLGRSRVRSG